MTLRPIKEKGPKKRGGRTPKQIHERRSPQAQRIDEALQARTATSAGDWAQDPSRSDLPGIDTPGRKQKVEAKAPDVDERGYDIYGNPTGNEKVETEPYWRVNHETNRVEIHFPGKPDEATRKQLKSNGWRWSPTNQAWQRKHTSNAEVDVRDFAKTKHADVGGTLSAQERFDRELDITQRQIERNESRAISHMTKSEDHKSRSDSISRHIPMGQPVLSGHHSEKRHRRDLDKIHNAERKRFEEYDKAERAKSRAESAKAKHEKMSSDPQFAERKIKRLEVDERYYKKHGMSKEHKRVSEDLQVWRAHLKSLGGRKYTPKMIKKGDKIRFLGTDYTVTRVNKKSVTISGWRRHEDWTYTVPYDKIKGHKKTSEIKDYEEGA